MADLYRKSALEKISNPEQLDKALVVTSPLSWLALIAVTLILVVTIAWSMVGRIPETLSMGGYTVAGNGNVSAMYSDWSGRITAVYVRNGDDLYNNQPVAEITFADGKVEKIYPDMYGVVTNVNIREGDKINSGHPILYFAPTPGDFDRDRLAMRDQLVLCYVPARGGNDMSGQLARGNRVHLTPAGENNQSSGYMMGTVLYVEKYATTAENVRLALGNEQIYSDNAGNGAIKAVVILPDLRQDVSTGNNPYVWSNAKGEKLKIDNGDTFTVRIIVKEVRPIEKLFAKIGEVLGW